MLRTGQGLQQADDVTYINTPIKRLAHWVKELNHQGWTPRSASICSSMLLDWGFGNIVPLQVHLVCAGLHSLNISGAVAKLLWQLCYVTLHQQRGTPSKHRLSIEKDERPAFGSCQPLPWWTQQCSRVCCLGASAKPQSRQAVHQIMTVQSVLCVTCLRMMVGTVVHADFGGHNDMPVHHTYNNVCRFGAEVPWQLCLCTM